MNATAHVSESWNAPQIVAALEEEIVRGNWAPGTRLPSERIFAEKFGVARSVIREALRVLEERGLISVAVGRGSFVQRVTPIHGEFSAELLARGGFVTANDVLTARESLEPAAAALAAQHRTEHELAALTTALARLDHAKLPHSADADLEFHGLITVASHNPVLQVMFGAIRALTHAMMARSQSDPAVIKAAPHELILFAIRDQDAAAAHATMLNHIHTARRYYGDDLHLPLTELLQHRVTVSPQLRAIIERLRTE